MNMESKYLNLAREARRENNFDDAKKYYDMVRIDDPENPEAKFYSVYFKVRNSVNKDLPNNFSEYTSSISNIIGKVKSSSLTDDEKISLVGEIAADHISLTTTVYDIVYKNANGQARIFDAHTLNRIVRCGVPSLESMGDQIVDLFGDNTQSLNAAANCWKAIFKKANWNQWYYYQRAGNKAASAAKWEETIKKINKIDPSFTAQKPKPVSCGNK